MYLKQKIISLSLFLILFLKNLLNQIYLTKQNNVDTKLTLENTEFKSSFKENVTIWVINCSWSVKMIIEKVSGVFLSVLPIERSESGLFPVFVNSGKSVQNVAYLKCVHTVAVPLVILILQQNIPMIDRKPLRLNSYFQNGQNWTPGH